MSDGDATGHLVLHLEDEAPNRALLRAVLERAGSAVVREATLVEAGDLATARAILAARRVDLVLLDVRLPDGNGLDLAAELRDLDPSSRPAVIAMSASVLPSERAAAIAAGADRFLAKPYRPDELVALMTQILSGSDAA